MGADRRDAEPPAGGVVTGLRVLLARLKGLVSRGRADAALDDDIQAHLELLTRDYIQRGLSRHDAQARRTTRVRRRRSDEGNLSRSSWPPRDRNVPAGPQICVTDAPSRSSVRDGCDRLAGDRDRCVNRRVQRLQRRDAASAARIRSRSARPAANQSSAANEFILVNPIYEELRARQTTLSGVFAANDT